MIKIDSCFVLFRYRCLQCFNFDMCQQCFYMGCTKKKHKLKHPIQEYCLSVSPDKKKIAFSTCIYFLLYIHIMSVIWLMNFIISNFLRQLQRWIQRPFWRHCAIISAKSIDRNQGGNISLLLPRVICFPTQREYAWWRWCCLSHLDLCLVQMEIPLRYSFSIVWDNYWFHSSSYVLRVFHTYTVTCITTLIALLTCRGERGLFWKVNELKVGIKIAL